MRRILVFVAAAWLPTIFTAPRADAANLNFQIDTVQSYMSLSGIIRRTAGGFSNINQPVSGSLNTQYGGHLLTDSDLSQIVFTGGMADALPNGTYEPGPALGDYGLSASLPSPEGSMLAAIRGFTFQMNGLAAPLFTGFDLSTVTVTATGGTFEANNLPTVSLVGTTASLVAGTGTLFESGDLRTLNLPLTLAFEKPIPGGKYSLEFTLSGLIVSTHTVPEPASGILLFLGAAGVLRRSRRGADREITAPMRIAIPAGHCRRSG